MRFGFQEKTNTNLVVQKKVVWATQIQYFFLDNIVLLVILGKFEPNLVLINVNKLKP